jgi:hypothetical protein
MIFNKSEYNPFPVIGAKAKALGRERYNAYFYDFVKKELFLGGVVPETEEEYSETLALLFNLDII